ncbi:MAG: class I SAM-dependent methyltransferase [Flavobacteriales bacterium]
MKEFWDARYRELAYAYGKEPNVFLAEQLPKLIPGKALFVAEGEGRNAVFAARLGWEVDAFDISESGKGKADALAKENNVQLNYRIESVLDIELQSEYYDLIVFVFTHFPEGMRQAAFERVLKSLNPGGVVILECFSKDHLNYNAHNNSGGPREASMLYDEEVLCDLMCDCETVLMAKEVVVLKEGPYHDGEGSVMRFVGRKKDSIR